MYDISIFMSLLSLGLGIMFANLHMCGMVLL